MSKGIISGFIGGFSSGMADAGKMMFANQLQKERDEANDLRKRAMQTQRQGFVSDEREAGQEFTASENKLNRESAQKVASTKAQAAADKDSSTTNMKDAAALRAAGYPAEVADAVAHGAMKQIKDEETGDMILVNALSNKPVGRLTSGGAAGDKQWIPEGGQTENAPVTKAHRAAAKEAASDKAGYMSTDETDFPSTSGDRKAWIKQEAQRLANQERGGQAGGIVNSAVDIDRSTPATDMPAPEKPTPKRETKAPYPDGTELKGKDGKIYIVKNGKPVLKTPQ